MKKFQAIQDELIEVICAEREVLDAKAKTRAIKRDRLWNAEQDLESQTYQIAMIQDDLHEKKLEMNRLRQQEKAMLVALSSYKTELAEARKALGA